MRAFESKALGLSIAMCVVFVGSGATADGLNSAEHRDIKDAATSTLRAWDRKFDKPNRFVLPSAFKGEAVLDRETQLVWQRHPRQEADGSFAEGPFETAVRHCFSVTTGGRMGWRLPTAEELTSLLVRRKITGNIFRAALPKGHPFLGITQSRYWSITEHSFGGLANRLAVALNEPEISIVAFSDISTVLPTLCVRGPGGGQSTSTAPL
jgi:hypothetical protein